MRNERNVSLDLLRTVSMLMVVLLHYLGSGKLMESQVGLWSANWFIVQICGAFCWICVNCFVLISGYFLCTSKFRLNKWGSLWVQALFYSVGLYLVCVAFGLVPFSLGGLGKNILVITMRRYWFVTVYLMLYAISPFLNCAIQVMTKKQHFLCCAVLLLFFSVLTNFVFISDFADVQNGFSLLWFCSLYFIAAYVRKYVPAESVKTSKAVCVYIGCSLFLLAARCLACWLTPKILGRITWTHLFHRYNSIPVSMGSTALFLTFRGIKIKGKAIGRIIGWAAPVSFSVYLLHHHVVAKELLWQWLDAPGYDTSVWMLPRTIIIVVGIYLVCGLIEHGRRWLFKISGLDAGISRLCDWADKRAKGLFDKLLEKG